MSYYFYGSTTPTDNTLTNRNLLLNVINTDPVLNVYNAISVTSISSGYTVQVELTNDIWSGPSSDQSLLSSIINIIFNAANPDSNPFRSVVTSSSLPSSIYDYTYDFSVGSTWLVTDLQQTFICYNNSSASAIWTSNPPFGITGGVGFGITGDQYPFDGSILQYDNASGLWIAQPGKWNSIAIPSTSLFNKGISGPTFSDLTGNVGTYLFSPGVDQQLYCNFMIPHNYAEGTDIIPFINYIPTSGNSGGVVWSLDYTWCNNGDTFSSPSTLSITTTTTNITNNYDSSDFTPISGTGMKISSSLLCRIYRNGTNVSDTYPDNIGLLSIGFKHQTLGLGSTQLSSK